MQPSHALKTPFFVSYLTTANTGIGTSTVDTGSASWATLGKFLLLVLTLGV